MKLDVPINRNHDTNKTKVIEKFKNIYGIENVVYINCNAFTFFFFFN